MLESGGRLGMQGMCQLSERALTQIHKKKSKKKKSGRACGRATDSGCGGMTCICYSCGVDVYLDMSSSQGLEGGRSCE